MALIGVRELREQATEVIRRVREEKEEYIITYQGRPVAVLLPINEQAVEKAIVQTSKKTAGDPWEAYHRIAEEIRKAWPEKRSTQEVLDEIRRD